MHTLPGIILTTLLTITAVWMVARTFIWKVGDRLETQSSGGAALGGTDRRDAGALAHKGTPLTHSGGAPTP